MTRKEQVALLRLKNAVADMMNHWCDYGALYYEKYETLPTEIESEKLGAVLRAFDALGMERVGGYKHGKAKSLFGEEN